MIIEKKNLVGIDPGFAGGLAFGNNENDDINIFRMPIKEVNNKRQLDLYRLNILFSTYKPEIAFIERVGAAPKQGVSSVFSFGKGIGCLLGMCAALGIEAAEVSPLRWKRHFKLFKRDKAASVKKFMELYPDIALIFKGCRTPHDGAAEAGLILKYGKEAEL